MYNTNNTVEHSFWNKNFVLLIISNMLLYVGVYMLFPVLHRASANAGGIPAPFCHSRQSFPWFREKVPLTTWFACPLFRAACFSVAIKRLSVHVNFLSNVEVHADATVSDGNQNALVDRAA